MFLASYRDHLLTVYVIQVYKIWLFTRKTQVFIVYTVSSMQHSLVYLVHTAQASSLPAV